MGLVPIHLVIERSNKMPNLSAPLQNNMAGSRGLTEIAESQPKEGFSASIITLVLFSIIRPERLLAFNIFIFGFYCDYEIQY